VGFHPVLRSLILPELLAPNEQGFCLVDWHTPHSRKPVGLIQIHEDQEIKIEIFEVDILCASLFNLVADSPTNGVASLLINSFQNVETKFASSIDLSDEVGAQIPPNCRLNSDIASIARSNAASFCESSFIGILFLLVVLSLQFFVCGEPTTMVAKLYTAYSFGPITIDLPRLAKLAACPAIARTLPLVIHSCLPDVG
jgi:hypothetical protein